jgi:membrane protein DedA with SNARE-associated domain
MAPGALRYPRNKFLTALAVGRGARFFTLAFVGRIYGQKILGFFSQYYKPLLYLVIALGVAAGIGALAYLKWYLPKKRASDNPQEVITRA